MYAFGCVPSRRFGQSLGVNLIPAKTCSYSCIYCQLGHTSRHTVSRQSFFIREDVMQDIRDAVRNNPHADFITIVGEGEPSLSADLGYILEQCREEFCLPRAVITNGSLLWQASLRQELQAADVVNITLSVCNEEQFRILHRPHKSLNLAQVWEGILRFSREYTGRLWVEVMLVDGVNTDRTDMEILSKRIRMLQPDRIFVMVPHRPPAVCTVRIPSADTILDALSIFGAEDVSRQEEGGFGVQQYPDAETSLLEICRRHPLRLEQARKIETTFGAGTLDSLLSAGKIKLHTYQGQEFLLPGEFIRS